MTQSACGLPKAHDEPVDDGEAAVTRQAPVLLCWIERSNDRISWWETAPPNEAPRRGVLVWLRQLGKLVWWISEADQTLAIGGLESLDPPSPALIERAMQLVEERWEG